MNFKLTTALVAAVSLLGVVSADAQRYGEPGYGQPWEGQPGYPQGGPGYPPPPPPNGGLPPGSYRATCHHIRFDGRMLTAQCEAVNGQWIPTGLDYGACGGWVENQNSQLVCHRRGRY